MSKKVSIYLSNANLTPSSYYRFTQYFGHTEARLHSSMPDYIYRWWHKQGRFGKVVYKPLLYLIYAIRTLAFLTYDFLTVDNGTVIISRTIVPHHMPLLHKWLVKRLARHNFFVWDFDDNILENKSISPSDFLFFSKYCHQIVVTNDFLKSLIDNRYAGKVTLLPTTDGDLSGFEPQKMSDKRRALYSKEIRLVWVATYTGLDYIRPLIPTLDEAAKHLLKHDGKKLSLHIVCNKPLIADTACLELTNILWEREVAKHEIISAHIGIMPLPDTDFTKGKGGFKLVQYMSASMPVIASNVGFNQQVINKDVGYLINDSLSYDGWKEAILELATDWEHYDLMANSARRHYDTHFSYEKNKEFWMKLSNME